MIFPENQDVKKGNSNKVSDFGREIDWDFEKNAPNIVGGKVQIAEGVHALRIWIEKALRTERFKWPIYKWSYGSEIDRVLESQMVGQSMNQALKQTIIDTLIHHPSISDIDEFKFIRLSDGVMVEFEVKTVLDDVLEVKWNVR